jgi:DNA polymerase III alpha subunit
MAMFLALIRPGKRHLVGKIWQEISESIWESTEEGYSFKKSHAVSYAVLVTLHMNLVNTSD